jgi:hypothetical protein
MPLWVSATKGFYGSVPVKSIVKFDGAMMAMKNGIVSMRILLDIERGTWRTNDVVC